jgi:hypothetical protein
VSTAQPGVRRGLPTTLDPVRTANKQLRDFLSRCGGAVSPVHTQELTEIKVLADLVEQAGHVLGSVTANPDQLNPASEAEIIEYASNLQRLKPVLEELQSALVRRRDQLQADRVRLRRAVAWADSLKLTR